MLAALNSHVPLQSLGVGGWGNALFEVVQCDGRGFPSTQTHTCVHTYTPTIAIAIANCRATKISDLGLSKTAFLMLCFHWQVVQLYMSWDPSNKAAALRQLVGFKRIFIKNGGSVTVQMTVKGEQMEVWVDDDIGFNVLPGKLPARELLSPCDDHNTCILRATHVGGYLISSG